MAAEVLTYYEYDPDAALSCPACGWSGRGGDNEEFHEGLFDVCCPKCDRMLLVVSLPTIGETRHAAAAGDAHAIADLSGADAQAARWSRARQLALAEPSQLPDLPGAQIRIDWDFEETDGETWTVMRHDGAEIWRELAYYEGAPRFAEVFEILRARYGTRLKEVRPTEASWIYLYGDDLRSPAKIDGLNASLEHQ